MKEISLRPIELVVMAILATLCGACGTLPRSKSNDSGQLGDRSLQRPEVIDETCIVTPRPNMAEVSGLLTYDYGGSDGSSPFTAKLDQSGQKGRSIVLAAETITSMKGVQEQRSCLELELRHADHRFEISWCSGPDNKEPHLTVYRRAWHLGFTKVQGPTLLAVEGPPDGHPGPPPHVFTIANGKQAQWLYIAIGDKKYVRFSVTRK
jgi:hypothetical protein